MENNFGIKFVIWIKKKNQMLICECLYMYDFLKLNFFLNER